MKIKKYLNPSGPLVKINGEWVPIMSDSFGNLYAVDKLGKRKNFKVNTKPKSATRDKEIVVTPKGNTIVDKKDLKPKPVGYSSAFQGNLIMTPVRKGFELLGKGLYAGSLALERGFTYGPMSNSSGMFTFAQSELTTGSTPRTDATFKYVLPYTMPSKWIGWARTGHAPHKEENTGLGDEDLNLMFDVASAPLAFKGIKSRIKAAPEAINATVDNIASTNLGKRAAEVAMRSRLENHTTANPIPDIIKGFRNAPWSRRMAVFDYILSGGKFINTADKPFGYRESFAPFKRYKSINDHFPKEVISDRLKFSEAMRADPQYNFGKYNGEQEVAYTGGFWNTHLPRREGYGDVIDAYLYGTEIDPAYGVRKISTGNPEDFGIHKKYVEEYYPEQSDNISVYETNKALNDNTVASTNIKSAKKSDPTRGDIMTSSSRYDSGGHRIEHGYYIDENGNPISETTYLLYKNNEPWVKVKKLPQKIDEHPEITYTTKVKPLKAYRSLDIYKFLSKDYKKSWGIGGLPIRFIDKAGTPLIVRTPWRDSPIQFFNPLYNKQGGKMNTLLFLKNGSGIHIKKKNRGKFTDYCGGKVTNECIRRAKASGNPTLVKRATFADNARHFKHKDGGKAFVEGVNVLDSNPKAYKYVKKKYKMRMAQNGTKVDWNSLANVGVNLLLSVAKNKKISEEAKAAKSMNKLTSRDFLNIYNLKLQEAKLLEELLAKNIPGINSSNIVAAANAWKNASEEYAALKNSVDLQNKIIDAQAQALKSDVLGSAISNVMLQGMGMLNNYLNNKHSNTITTTTPNISFNKKIDFGNIKTNFGLLGTYSTNSGYLPKQLSFDWSKVGIQ